MRCLLLLPLCLAACVSESEQDTLARPFVDFTRSFDRVVGRELGPDAVGIRLASIGRDAGGFFDRETAGAQRLPRDTTRLLGREVDRATQIHAPIERLIGDEWRRFEDFSLQPLASELSPEAAARRAQHMLHQLVPVLRLDHRPMPEISDPEHRASLADDRPVATTLERILRRVWN